MERVDEVNALIVAATSIKCLLQLVGTVKDRKSGVRLQSCRAQDGPKRNSRPFPDCAPPRAVIEP